MTKTERQRLQQDFYEAAMRGAKLLDDRTNFKWVNQVKPRRTKGRDTLAQVNAVREANGGWARRPGEVAYASFPSEIDGGYYGFYDPSFADAQTALLNAAWQKVVRRRHYLRDLRKRRKMGLTPGTRLTMLTTDGRVEASL